MMSFIQHVQTSPLKRKLLITAAICTMGLSLSACQTTQSTSSYQPENAEELSQIDKVLMRAANNAQARGKSGESLELLENMYSRNSSDVEIATRYAKSLRFAKRYQRASMVLSPFARDYGEHKHVQTLIEYSALKSAMNEFATAEEYGRMAVNDAPEIARAHHVLGIALDAQGHHKEAEERFREAMTSWQGDPAPLLNNLGLNLAAQGKVEEAIEVLSKAAAANPGRIEIERNLRIVKALRNVPYIANSEDQAPIPVPSAKPKQDEEANTEKEKEEDEATVEKAIEETEAKAEEAAVEEVKEDVATEELAEETKEVVIEAVEEVAIEEVIVKEPVTEKAPIKKIRSYSFNE